MLRLDKAHRSIVLHNDKLVNIEANQFTVVFVGIAQVSVDTDEECREKCGVSAAGPIDSRLLCTQRSRKRLKSVTVNHNLNSTKIFT